MAVNKHGHDSVEVLPVPIKLQRDHHNERWPWHNWDSSQQKPDGWSDRRGQWMRWQKNREARNININNTSIFHFMRTQPTVVWVAGFESHCQWFIYFGQDRQLLDYFHPPCWYSCLLQAIHVWYHKKPNWERDWLRVVCTCSGWDNTPAACREAHVLTTEKDNDSSLLHFNLCEAAWHHTALKALWRDADTVRDE